MAVWSDPGAESGKRESTSSGAVHPAADRYKEITQLRYVGFRHLENQRRFRFERVTPGAATQCFEVAANLALFHTLRIAIQEGPALCMRVIAAELESGTQVGRSDIVPAYRTAHAGLPGEPARTRHKIAQGAAASFGLFGARAPDLRAGSCSR